MKRHGSRRRLHLKGLVASLALAAAVSGCRSVSYVAPNKPASGRQVDHDLSFFLFGLVGEEHVRVDQDCGAAGPAGIHSRATIVDQVLSFVTIGIYTPRTVTVTCAR